MNALLYFPTMAGDALLRLESQAAAPATLEAAGLMRAGRLQDAADLLATAASGPAATPWHLFGLSLVAYMARDIPKCAELARMACAGGAGAAALALEGAAALGLGDHPQAIRSLRGALRMDPRHHAAHALLWSALERAGMLPRATAAIKERLSALPVRPPAPATPVTVEATTLCIVDCVNHRLAARALAQSMQGCRFEQVKFISDAPSGLAGVEDVAIAPLNSAAEYSRFMVKSLLAHVDTDYVLVIQWDGYVTCPQAWTPEFLLYDYVGARWTNDFGRLLPHHNVGNGGFSLRSRTLLEALQDPRIADLHPEDEAICRRYRSLLEDRHGIVFADDATADRFSFEHAVPAGTPFGFHGQTNLARFVDDPAWAALDFIDDTGGGCRLARSSPPHPSGGGGQARLRGPSGC